MNKALFPVLVLAFTASTFTVFDLRGGEVRPDKEAELPNILILYADDMGVGDLQIQNPDSKIPTPHLDQLARQGILFTDGHSSSGICTPSRYALLTGRHHWRDFHGIVGAMEPSVFSRGFMTLPAMLQEKGYHTSAIGKWHLGWDWKALLKPDAKTIGMKNWSGIVQVHTYDSYNWEKPIPDGPLAHGFDYYFGDTVINFPPYTWIENDRVVDAPDRMLDTSQWKPIKEGVWECRPGPMFSGWDPYQNIPVTTAKAIEYIQEQARTEDPFFLYFAFPSPHAPIIPNDEFDGASGAGPYGDFVVETDDACGKILKALEESGQAENTIVIFSADNGTEYYAYKRDEVYDHWSSNPLRGLKRDLYEGGHRVPFIIKWPGVISSGRTSDALVSQIDIMGTLAAYLAIELPLDAAVDSHNLLPILEGTGGPVRTQHVHNTYEGSWAMRSDSWLLIDAQEKHGYHNVRAYDKEGIPKWERKHGYPEEDQLSVELYDLSNDIEQKNNVALQFPDIVSRLKKELKTIRERGYTAPRLLVEKYRIKSNPIIQPTGIQPTRQP